MEERVEKKTRHGNKGNVLYLVRRDQRLQENYAVQLGYELSYENNSCLYLGVEFFRLKMNERQRIFVLEGLAELYSAASEYNIELTVIEDLEAFVDSCGIGSVVLDFCPLRESREREEEVTALCERKGLALYMCDAHNIVPCRLLAKYKRTAKAVRTDLFKLSGRYLVEFKGLEAHRFNTGRLCRNEEKKVDFGGAGMDEAFVSGASIKTYLMGKRGRKKGCLLMGGYSSGMQRMSDFFAEHFGLFADERNNPDVCASSGLSPWFNFGQISVQKVVCAAQSRFGRSDPKNLQAFVNEAFVWREIAEHFVYHEKSYDSLEGALGWAQETLVKHEADGREEIFDEGRLERAETGDSLWDAGQRELVETGKMHGYVRMYWAKRLLRWTKDASTALRIAVHLNDKYAMDGNNPNGYLGIMWSICGSMDRAFKEREILGKIRPMKSFKAPGYIAKWGE